MSDKSKKLQIIEEVQPQPLPLQFLERGKIKNLYGDEKRSKVMHYIIRYKEVHDGLSPTMREIMVGCGMFSTSHVDYYLQQLEEMDLIKRSGRRGIQVIGGVWLKPEETEGGLMAISPEPRRVQGTPARLEVDLARKEKHDWRNVDF